MVVLDEHCVVQAEAVIEAAAAAHGVFLQQAQAGRGLAGTDDARLGAGDCIGQSACLRGDAREAADEVQRHALPRQDAARRSLQRGQGRAGLRVGTVPRVEAEFESGVEQAKGGFGADQSGDPAGLARLQHRFGATPGRHYQLAGDVARAAQIFLQRAAHDGFEKQRMGRAGKSLGHARLLVVAGDWGFAIMRSASASVRKVRTPNKSVCG